jgi:hypothetical protein
MDARMVRDTGRRARGRLVEAGTLRDMVGLVAGGVGAVHGPGRREADTGGIGVRWGAWTGFRERLGVAPV